MDFEEEVIKSGVRFRSVLLSLAFVSVGKTTQNLCFGAVSLTIRKGFVTFGNRRLNRKRSKQKKKIKKLNAKIESIIRKEWELTTVMARTDLQNKKRKKPVWK